MRIAILTNAFPPLARGGAGRIAHIHAHWLANHGHEVKVWTVAPFPESGAELEVKTFKPRTTVLFANLGKKSVLARLWFHLEDSAPNLDAVDQIRKWNPDVLISHNLTGCGWGTPRLLKAAGVKWLHVLHDVQAFEPSGQIMSNVKRQTSNVVHDLWWSFWAARRKKALGSPDVVISPSNWLLEMHKQYDLFATSECKVIPNPVQMPDGFADAQISGEQQILYVGRLSDDKGVKVLLDAWMSLNPKPGKLNIIGSGPLETEIKNNPDVSIEYLGEQTNEQVMIKMREANLVVLPSLVMENQPTVLLEAIAADTRVLATDVGGVREMLESYGTIVAPGDVAELAKGITQALAQPAQNEIREQILKRHEVGEVMGLICHSCAVPVRSFERRRESGNPEK